MYVELIRCNPWVWMNIYTFVYHCVWLLNNPRKFSLIPITINLKSVDILYVLRTIVHYRLNSAFSILLYYFSSTVLFFCFNKLIQLIWLTFTQIPRNANQKNLRLPLYRKAFLMYYALSTIFIFHKIWKLRFQFFSLLFSDYLICFDIFTKFLM